MSKNLQTDRILYNGKPGPFYLDVEDKTDGPDGTTKPVTKDVLQEMIVANFPELQKVKDAELLNELQSVKQQQSQILERLNSPIDTRLSGSNVENGLDVNLLNRAIEQETIIDSLAYRGSSNLIAQEPFNAHAYKDFEISFRNSLIDEEGNGVPVSVGFVTNGAAEVYLTDGRSVLYSYYVQGGRVWNEIPGNDRLYYLTDLPLVGRGNTEDAELHTPNIWKLFKSNNNTPQIAFGRVDHNQVPVDGTLSCWLDGVKN